MTVICFQVLHIDVCIGRHLFEFRDLHNACYLFLISIVVMNVIGVHVRCFIWRRCLARSRALIWGRHTTLPQQQRPNPPRCATWCREVEATACLIPQNAFAILISYTDFSTRSCLLSICISYVFLCLSILEFVSFFKFVIHHYCFFCVLCFVWIVRFNKHNNNQYCYYKMVWLLRVYQFNYHIAIHNYYHFLQLQYHKHNETTIG